MMTTYLVALVLALLHPVAFGVEKNKFLRFVPALPNTKQQLEFHSPGPVSPIEIDATWSQQVRIRLLAFLNEDPQIKLHCHVDPLDTESELVVASLCHKRSLNEQPTCIDPRDQTPQFGPVTFDAIGTRSQGYTFSTKLPVGRHLLDAFYFCKYRNSRGELLSNLVEIQDVCYHHIQLAKRKPFPTPQYWRTLSAADLPLQLNCGQPSPVEAKLPPWADHSFPNPFRWSFCEMSSSTEFTAYDCYKRKVLVRVSDYFEHVVYPNGTLFLLSRTSADWRRLGLVCVSDARPSSIFASYFGGHEGSPRALDFNSSIPYPANTQLRPFSPVSQTVELRKGTNEVTQLIAVYQANMPLVHYEWTKDGKALPSDFPQPTAFILTLPSVIHNNHSGVYVLRLTDSYSSLEFRFIVKVDGPPDVLVPPPSVIFVMEGKNATFDCVIENFRKAELYINGENIWSQSKQLYEHDPYLKDVTIHPLRIIGSRLQYHASNMHYQTGSPFGSTHTVTITASNAYGVATVSTLVAVLPRPEVRDSPANYLCGPPCINTVAHTFDCKLDLSRYRMVHYEQSWDFNGTDVAVWASQGDRRSEYLRVEGTKLHLAPVTDPASVGLFAHSRATCRLRIYSDKGDTPGDTPFQPSPNSLIYDTRSDKGLQRLLTTEINLILDTTTKPASASISWIAAVIIAVILLLAVGLLITCLVMRGRGETYLLDKEERALGNDPEKELREHEAFRTYERADEPLLHGSRCSLNDDSAEIGSDADGELDDYNLDPGKFNEEGSFIDQYATETRYKGAARLPTLPRSNDPQL